MIIDNVKHEAEAEFVINEVDISECDEGASEISKNSNFIESSTVSNVIEEMSVDPLEISSDDSNPNETFFKKSKRKRVKCKFCQTILKASAQNLRRHLKGHQVKCKICGMEIWNGLKDFNAHMALHNEPKDSEEIIEPGQPLPYECSQCAIRFRNSKELEGHKRTHDRYEKCTACGVIILKALLGDHSCRKKEKKLFKCEK